MRENSEFDITNAGYTIIATVPVYTEEIVIGSRLTKTGDMEYVCWFYNRSHDDYYWGIYVNTYEEALSALFKRVREYYRLED